MLEGITFHDVPLAGIIKRIETQAFVTMELRTMNKIVPRRTIHGVKQLSGVTKTKKYSREEIDNLNRLRRILAYHLKQKMRRQPRGR